MSVGKWIRRIIGTILGLIVVAVGVLAIAISRDAPCGSPPALAQGATPMKAVVRRCYGTPDVLAVEEVEKPVPADDQMLVKVHAGAINPLDWHRLRGTPYFMRLGEGFGTPKEPRIGIDFAGEVIAVGPKVTRYQPGDRIFGGKSGSLAEYVVVNEAGSIARMPANLSYEQAASVYVAGVTAIQALRDRAGIRPGQKVLINGASGGVGTFSVQVAKALGAEVTGVCSTRNVELVRSLGADHVIDYTRDDFTKSTERYDVVMDNVVNRPMMDIRRILAPRGKYLVVGGGGADADPWIGALKGPIKAYVISWFVDEDMAFFMGRAGIEEVATLGQWMEEGKVKPVVDRIYPMPDIAEAMRYLETGHARGKVVIDIQ